MFPPDLGSNGGGGNGGMGPQSGEGNICSLLKDLMKVLEDAMQLAGNKGNMAGGMMG